MTAKTHIRPRFIALTSLILVLAWSVQARAQPPSDLALEPIATGLSQPVAVAHSGDGTGRLFIAEQVGRILVQDGTNLLPQPFLDITSVVDNNGEQGLLGLTFHPDYANNGFFFVNYIRDPPGPGLDRTVVARYTVSANPNLADPSSAVTLLEVAQDFSNHNGGNLLFGPDGYLYIGMGDGGDAGDPLNRAQDPGSLLGKMLRIDVDQGPPEAPNDLCGLVANYGVPATNPFLGVAGTCDEIWGVGLRNPWRFSFDRLSGDMFIGDVGQGTREEINYQPAGSGGGENWGWRCYEGNFPFLLGGCGPVGSYRFPILQYPTGDNCAVTGGYRYRGNVIGGLVATYVYGDFCSGRVWFATQAGGNWTRSLWMDLPYNVSSFGEDEAGELYVVNYGGDIHRLVSPSSIFTDGFESGDTAVWSFSPP